MTHAECRARDARIIERRREGFTIEELAEVYGLSPGRISQIIMRDRLAYVDSRRVNQHA